jgi:hypothetical protein
VYLFNFSPLQNAEDVSFRVLCDKGTFHPRNPQIQGPEFEWRSKESYKSILHFGEPTIEGRSIRIPRNVVVAGEIMNIVFSFGCRNSPAKISEYRLDLRRLTIPNAVAENAVTERNENILYIERQETLGTTKADVLRISLGR